MKLPLNDVVAATGGRLLDAGNAPAEVVRHHRHARRSSRAIRSLRCAARRFDGHDFVATAVERGARMVVVEGAGSALPEPQRCWSNDTRVAYLALAALARRRFDGRVVAHYRQHGKNDDPCLRRRNYWRRAMASASHPRRATKTTRSASANCCSGSIRPKHDVAVVEMGARHPGDIATLVRRGHARCRYPHQRRRRAR